MATASLLTEAMPVLKVRARDLGELADGAAFLFKQRPLALEHLVDACGLGQRGEHRQPGERLQEIMFAREEPSEQIGIAGIVAAKPVRASLQTVKAWVATLNQALEKEDREAVFRRCAAKEHHYHLVCRSCGATIEIQAPEVEQWATQVAGESGFTRVGHTVEIYGVCPPCSSCR